MQLTIVSPMGLKNSELRAIDRIKKELPDSWHGYASFLISDGVGLGMEIDLLLITADRFIVCEIKEWQGEVRSDGKKWIQTIGTTERSGFSPVEVKRSHAARINTLLSKELESLWGTWYKVDFVVVMAGSAKFVQKSPLDEQHVLTLDEFCQIKNPAKYRELLPDLPYGVEAKFNSRKILRPNNPSQINIFDRWRMGGKAIKKRYRREFNYQPSSDQPSFIQPISKAYSEYSGFHAQAPASKSLMRFWDFAQLGIYASTIEQRANIGLREQDVILFVGEENHQFKKDFLMEPLHHYGLEECSEDLVEVFAHSPSLTRLNLHLAKTPHLLLSRFNLLRELLAPIAGLHSLGVFHRDLSFDRLWYDDVYKTVVISGLCTAKFPDIREKKSISDFYSILSTRIIRSPEDVLGQTEHNAAVIDVYQLGVMAYEIAFNQKPIMVDEIFEWVSPKKDPFDGCLDEWIKKAIKLVPTDRFSDANEMLSALNIIQLETQPSTVDDNQIVMTELQTFYKNNFPIADWPPKGPMQYDDTKGKNVYESLNEEVSVRVLWWPQLAPQPNQIGQNRRLLQFLKRCQIFHKNELSAQRVLDFATTNSGVYAVLEYANGIPLSDWIEQNKDRDEYLVDVLNISLDLIHAVNQLHDIEISHGDLKPDNILIQTNEDDQQKERKFKVLLIDCIDINYLAEIPQNFFYAPLSESTSFERDRFAVYRIIQELIPDNSEITNKLHFEIKDKIGENFDQIPLSIEPLTKTIIEIQNISTEEDIESKVFFWHPDLETIQKEHQFKSDLGRYYVSVKVDSVDSKHVKVFIAGLSQKLIISCIHENEVLRPLHVNLRTVPIPELIQSSNFANSRRYGDTPPILRQEIILKSTNPENNLLTTVLSLPTIRQDLKLEVSDSEQKTIMSSKWLQRLWLTLLEAEDSLHPVVTTRGMPLPLDNDNSGLWFVPIIPPLKEFEFDNDSEIRVIERNERGWTLGTVDLKKSDFNSGKLVLKVRSRSNKIFNKFDENIELTLQNQQARSSQERRKNALERVVNGEAVIPNLIQYFDETSSTTIQESQTIAAPNPQVMQYYQLDESKIEALHQILNQKVSVVMGPPGTGKTQLLAHTLDHLNRQPDIKRILLVSQSNVAVDEVASKARHIINKIAIAENKDPAVVMPSMVRLGDKQKVNESLHDIHVEALLGQYRTRFYREFEYRMLAFCGRLGVSQDFILQISQLYRDVGRELYEYKMDILHIHGLDLDENSENKLYGWKKAKRSTAQTRKERLERILLNKLKAYDDNPQSVLNLDDPLQSLINNLGSQNGIYNLEQLKKIGQLLSISHQWLIRLESDMTSGFASFMAKTRQWIIGTLVGVGRQAYDIKENQYDIAIIDEAARASANELAMAMQSAKRIVLVGDYLQLPPVYEQEVVDEVTRKIGLDEETVRKTDFERAYKVTKGYMLSTQYRMAKPIGDLISYVFYETEQDMGMLHTGRDEAAKWLKALDLPWNKVVSWIDTSSLKFTEIKDEDVKGIANTTEVGIIKSLLHSLLNDLNEINALEKLREWANKDKNPPIGIITGYSMQVREIEKMIENDGILHSIKDLVRIDTIDSYQGSENRIVMLSLVRHNEKNSTGFMSEKPRINVAISRAKERLIIIGATQMWVNDNELSPLGQVYQYINERNDANHPDYQIIKMNELEKSGVLV